MSEASPETIAETLGYKKPSEAFGERLTGLMLRYQEPWRHHHTWEHPQELFNILQEHKDEVSFPSIIGWAMLYHDAIYDPQASRGRNEEQSALLAVSELSLELEDWEKYRVNQFIQASATHDTDQVNPDLDFFLDADLAILGANPARYDRYALDIRREYRHVPDEVYIPGRIAILGGLASRVEESGIYRTDLFRDTHEGQAHANIEREIDRLTTQ